MRHATTLHTLHAYANGVCCAVHLYSRSVVTKTHWARMRRCQRTRSAHADSSQCHTIVALMSHRMITCAPFCWQMPEQCAAIRNALVNFNLTGAGPAGGTNRDSEGPRKGAISSRKRTRARSPSADGVWFCTWFGRLDGCRLERGRGGAVIMRLNCGDHARVWRCCGTKFSQR